MPNVYPPETGKDIDCPYCKAEIELDLTTNEKSYDSIFIECYNCNKEFEAEIIVSYEFKLLEVDNS